MSEHAEPVARWWVRYEPDSEAIEVLIPHAWRHDLPVASEGPVVYQTTIQVPRGRASLVFHGVSYQAEVQIDGTTVAVHQGIWDGFVVPLDGFSGRSISVEVIVTKNGGKAFPVNEVASGFLPYVFHTFGGIHGAVDLVRGSVDLECPPAASRVSVDVHRVYVDGKPFYMRGLLHWGWYPDLGHVNPSRAAIRDEVLAMKERGFNLVKFCLWVPSHSFLEILREEGMFAWMELPLWNPSMVRRRQITEEFGRIVRQYRRHDNIVAWTIGCELGATTPPDFRAYLTQLVRNLTGCPLVKDSSGGAEMYGGDLCEFGDFYDFHPYCDAPQYPAVLDSLLPGARKPLPLFLGEFADADTHRDLARLGDEIPYWGSSLAELNPVGVRWQYDLPSVLIESRFANHPSRNGHAELMESTRVKALFMRKQAVEAVRARDLISGYVVTGWRDTPISSAGFLDDWGENRFSRSECESWNAPSALFLIPNRKPTWTAGGNRPGWTDPFNHFAGQVFWRIGLHTEEAVNSGLCWRIVGEDGSTVAEGAEPCVRVPDLSALEVGSIYWQAEPGAYRLEVEFGAAVNAWPVWVVAGRDPVLDFAIGTPELAREGVQDGGLPQFAVRSQWEADPGPGIFILSGDETAERPFWREAAYEFVGEEFWAQAPFANRWSRLLPICGDRVLRPEWLGTHLGEYEVLMNRIDVRTYEEAPVLVRCGDRFMTSLRPMGGLAGQPTGLATNPAGYELLRCCMKALATGAGKP